MPMKRVRVDFVAVRSVIVAVNDKDDAIQTAEEWLSRKDPNPGWEYDQRSNLEVVDGEADNESVVTKCPHCGEEYADPDIERVCPFCGKEEFSE